MAVYRPFGNGVATDFPVPMALPVSSVSVNGSPVGFTQPGGRHMIRLGAAAAYHAAADATNITVTYLVAPASGTNNVVLRWSALP